MEITGASGPPSSAAPRRKMHRAVRKIPLSKAGLTAAQQSMGSLATAVMGSASAGPQAEEAAQGLGQLCGEVTSPLYQL